MIGYPPLVMIEHTANTGSGSGYFVTCRECGDVTRTESGGQVAQGSLEQANLYARRHLTKHLQMLMAELAELNR